MKIVRGKPSGGVDKEHGARVGRGIPMSRMKEFSNGHDSHSL